MPCVRERRARFAYRHDPDWERSPLTSGAAEAVHGLWRRCFDVPVPPGGPVGQRLVFFSDLHWSRHDTRGSENLIAQLNATDADWVLFGGDLTHYLEHAPPTGEILSAIRARRGKFAVLGNREAQHFWLPPQFWREFYGNTGFQLLVNESWVPPNDARLAFAGLDDCRHGHPEPASLAALAGSRRFVVLLCHSPDAIGHRPEHFLGHLILAGHTHGGQIRLPGWGPLYTSSAYGRQFDRGWHRRRQDGTRLYVTTGVGESGWVWVRHRLLCPPEIVVLNLVENGS